MKTIKLLFTVTALAIATIAGAVEKPKMNVIPLTVDRAIVAITNENAAYFELSIHAQDGSVVYYKQSNKPLTDYQKVFDFANLEDGKYVLNLKVKDTQLARNFEIANHGISVGNSKMTFDPYFAYKDNVLKFSYLNFDKENLNLSIYQNGDLVYKSKLGNEFAMSSGYDLSKLESGDYTVILSSLNDEYSYNLVR